MKEISLNEDITRYLFDGDFDKELRVKGIAFSPPKGRNAVSVFRIGTVIITGQISTISDAEIWEIGKTKLGRRPGKGSVIARSDFKVQHVISADVGLNVVEHKEEGDRHAHIQPWETLLPNASEEEQRKFFKRRETTRNKLAIGLKAVLIPT